MYLFLSCCLGGLAGVVCALFDLLIGPGFLFSHGSAVFAIKIYSLSGFFLGFVSALLLFPVLLFKKGIYPNGIFCLMSGDLFPAVLLPYLISGYYMNHYWLPWELDDRRSMLFNAVFTFIYFVPVILVTRLLLRHSRTWVPVRLSPIHREIVICVAGILCILDLLSHPTSRLPVFKDNPKEIRNQLKSVPTPVPFTKSDFPIFIVLIDALRGDNVSCYGYSRRTTPHIDAFAHDATFFENGFSSSPWTIPSVATLFSGLYPSVHTTLLP